MIYRDIEQNGICLKYPQDIEHLIKKPSVFPMAFINIT